MNDPTIVGFIVVCCFLIVFAICAYLVNRPSEQPEIAATSQSSETKSDDLPDLIAALERAIHIKPVDLVRDVASSDGSCTYRVDLKKQTCDCPDWHKIRSSLPPEHLRRFCKHMVSIILSETQMDAFGKAMCVTAALWIQDC